MYKSIPLHKAVKYCNNRISANSVSLDTFISTDNILQNRSGITNANKLPPGSNAMPAYKNDNILLANIRPYLKKIWYADRSGGCSADVLVFDVNENYFPKFIYYAMIRDDFFDHVMKCVKGTKMPRGDKSQILEYLIPDFNFTTQKKIAYLLSVLDSKIELNNKINAELEAIAKTIYEYWFVQFEFPNKKGKPYKSSGGKMVWSEELKREVPEGWEVKALKDIAVTGSGGTPLSTKKLYYEGGNIPWINSGEVNAAFIIKAKKFITQSGLENSSAKLFPKGTILMAMYGATAGQVSLIDFSACTNQAICGIIPNDKQLVPYLKFALHQMYEYLINLSSGSARDNLTQDKIKELVLLIPSKVIIDSFFQLSQPCFEKILINLKENQQLAELRDYLLPMLMNGQVRVKAENESENGGEMELESDSYRMVAENSVKYSKSIK